MSEMDELLEDYIFSGIDDEGLTSNDEEIMRYVYGEDAMDRFANDTVKFDAYRKERNSDRKEKLKRRFVLFQKEDCRNRTKTGKEAAIFYAMRDSMKMTTVEFAELYNPTGFGAIFPAGDKSSVLYCMDEKVYTQLGNTDLDHTMLLVDWGHKRISVDFIYGIEKRVWNLGRGEKAEYNFNNPAEINSKIMAELMLNGVMKFHDFFPQFLHRIHDPEDPVNRSIEMKTLLEVHGDNLNE